MIRHADIDVRMPVLQTQSVRELTGGTAKVFVDSMLANKAAVGWQGEETTATRLRSPGWTGGSSQWFQFLSDDRGIV